MTSLLDTPKPGQFRARCNLARPHPISELPHYLRAEYEAKGWRKGVREVRIRRNVLPKECYLEPLCDGFETTDRAEFEAHMRDVHGGGLYRWDNGSLSSEVRTVANYSPRMRVPVPMWKGPRLTPEGKPFDTSKHPVRECEGCGLIAEFDGTQAWELWWREHVDFCTGEAVAS